MDAFKSENISTDLENLPSDLLNNESSLLAQDECTAAEPVSSIEELADAQSLEDEFADVTQPAIQAASEFDMSAPETESEVDLDKEFADFQTSHNPDSENASVNLGADLDQISELLLDEAFEVPKTTETIGAENGSATPDIDIESELSQMQALFEDESTGADKSGSDMILDSIDDSDAGETTDLSQLEAQLNSQDEDFADVVLDLELDSEPDLIADPLLVESTDTETAAVSESDVEAPIETSLPSDEHFESWTENSEKAFQSLDEVQTSNALMDELEGDFELYSESDMHEEASPTELEPPESYDVDMVSVDTVLESVSEAHPSEDDESEALATDIHTPQETEIVMADDALSGNVPDSSLPDERVVELESTIQKNQQQIQELQGLVNSKIDPEIHTHLLQELRQYKTKVAELEDSLQAQQAEQEDHETPFSSADYEALQQLVEQQTQTISDLQATIARLEADIKDWQSQAESQIDPEDYGALQAQSTSQSELITSLEAEVQTLKSSYEQAQIESSQRIEPTEYQAAQAEMQRLATQVQDWEQRYEALSQELSAQTQLVSERIDATEHQTLKQSLQDYREKAERLEVEKSQFEQAVQTWQKRAESKIERAEYEAVLEQVQILKEKNARSLWARIMDWFMGK